MEDNNEIVIEYLIKNKYKIGLVLTSLLSIILILSIIFSDQEIKYKEKIVTKTETKYIDEIGNEVANPNQTYWYYYYKTLDGVEGYGASQSDTKYFNFSDVYNDIKKTIDKKYNKKHDFISFDCVVQISEKEFNNLK